MGGSAWLRCGSLGGGLLIALAATGCAASPHRDVVAAIARSFVSAVERGDGATACRMLTDDAKQSASGAADVPCEKAITSVKEHGNVLVHGIQVWGDAAQVKVAADVLFLRRISGTWLVNAAGCTAQPKGPYDCTVGS